LTWPLPKNWDMDQGRLIKRIFRLLKWGKIIKFVIKIKMEDINLDTRKINLINWISSIEDADIIDKMEKLKKEKTDWWDTLKSEDKQAIEEGIAQLDRGEFLSHSQVRENIKEKFNF
ncbi:MAG: hypothetical protein JW798_01860, partial [Prolixibacteraceae bacterium]|nr:hypothetical protein [Prolixibacteraceae bacterium]